MNMAEETAHLAKYMIAHALRDPVSEYILNVRRDLSERFSIPVSKNPPHITMKYSFEPSDMHDLSQVESILSDFRDSHVPAMFTFEHFSHFHNPNVIYLYPSVSPGMRMAHHDLMRGLKRLPWMSWDEHEGKGIHFHATLARMDISSGLLTRMASYLETLPRPHFECMFNSVTLYKRESPAPLNNGEGLLIPVKAYSLR